MDVAGVQLGVGMDAARGSLDRAGYRCTTMNVTRSYEQQVQWEVDRRQGTARDGSVRPAAIYGWNCNGGGGEELQVWFAQPVAGPVVHALRLFLPPARFNTAAVVAKLGEKFGTPTRGSVEEGWWCMPGARCEGSESDSPTPMFRTFSVHGLTVLGSRGTRAQEAEQAVLMAEVERRAPKQGTAAF